MQDKEIWCVHTLSTKYPSLTITIKSAFFRTDIIVWVLQIQKFLHDNGIETIISDFWWSSINHIGDYIWYQCTNKHYSIKNESCFLTPLQADWKMFKPKKETIHNNIVVMTVKMTLNLMKYLMHLHLHDHNRFF